MTQNTKTKDTNLLTDDEIAQALMQHDTYAEFDPTALAADVDELVAIIDYMARGLDDRLADEKTMSERIETLQRKNDALQKEIGTLQEELELNRVRETE